MRTACAVKYARYSDNKSTPCLARLVVVQSHCSENRQAGRNAPLTKSFKDTLKTHDYVKYEVSLKITRSQINQPRAPCTFAPRSSQWHLEQAAVKLLILAGHVNSFKRNKSCGQNIPIRQPGINWSVLRTWPALAVARPRGLQLSGPRVNRIPGLRSEPRYTV